LAIMDRDLRVIAASRAYYRMFPADFSLPPDQLFCKAVAPLWSERALQILGDVASSNVAAEDFEIELDVPGAGPRRMLLNAGQIRDDQNPQAVLLIGLHDVTELREAERLKAEVEQQQTVLLQEAHHRIANSLQLVASILLLKARTVKSEETRMHLREVHKRLILVASVQRQLCSAGMLDELEFGPYVAQLCQSIAHSMTNGDRRIAIHTSATGGKIKSDDAVNFGLIVTELVINAIKHGFPDGRRGVIDVAFAANGPDWQLSVSDNGVGLPQTGAPIHSGLGANIVEALARHLKAKVEIATGGIGTSTSIIHTERDAASSPMNESKAAGAGG
ncbi:MAG TPA: histidine kinase dimerization/phosphoacceptor domain -containing protein, partial [Rhizomicrobium sp.]